MRQRISIAIGAASLCAVAAAQATTITFDDLAAGSIVSNQYAGVGAVFTANAFSGADQSSSSVHTWATNTDMTVVSATGNDTDNLGTPSLESGMILGSYNGWYSENGDPSFRVTFSRAMASVSATFAAVATGSDVAIYAYNGSTLVGETTGGANYGQFVLSVSSPVITSVVLTPGSYDDYVAVDNIVFAQAVPEPSAYALMALGLGVLPLLRRKAAKAP